MFLYLVHYCIELLSIKRTNYGTGEDWSDVTQDMLMVAEYRWMADDHKEEILLSIFSDQSCLRKRWANSGCGKLSIAEGMYAR